VFRSDGRDAMFLERLKAHAERHRMFPPNTRVLVAVSGGPDSMALLVALDMLSHELDLELGVGHVDHGLRGADSDGDESFVRAIADDLRHPFAVARVDVRARAAETHESIEMAARALRREALLQLAASSGADRIALGHTWDDQQETILLNLARGTGCRGLAGMPAASGDRIVRPILFATRAEVLTFLLERGTQYRTDRSNADEGHSRNYLRLSVLPGLRARWGRNVLAAARDTAELERAALDHFADEWLARQGSLERMPGEVTLDRDELCCLPDGALHAVVRRATERVLGHALGVYRAHVGEVVRLLRRGDVRSRVELPCGVAWELLPEGVRVSRRDSETPTVAADAMALPLPIPGRVAVPWAGCTLSSEWRDVSGNMDAACPPDEAALDADATALPLQVRPFRHGDRIRPLGMGGHSRKIKELFREKRVSLTLRTVYPLVVDAHDAPVWAPGLATAEPSRVTRETQRMVHLRCVW